MKDLVWEMSSKFCEKVEVGTSSNVKFSRLYPRGREVRSWGNIRAFRYVESQATAEIFLAPRPHGRRSQLLGDTNAKYIGSKSYHFKKKIWDLLTHM
jgi:hypothetical protein